MGPASDYLLGSGTHDEFAVKNDQRTVSEVLG